MRHQDQPPTPEQIEIARWTASLGAITAEALAQRMGASIPSARGKLLAAERRQLVSRARPLAGRPSLFTVTRAGLRACGSRGIQICTVGEGKANHLIMCAAAAAPLERRYPNHRVMGELELRRDEREHGRLLASAKLTPSQRTKGASHCPDLVLWPTTSKEELPIAVEVELTTKSNQRLVEICRAWARSRIVVGVLYFAPEDVQRAVLRAVSEARAAERVVVLPLDLLLAPTHGSQADRQSDENDSNESGAAEI